MRISSPLLTQIELEARKALPKEACGFLVGLPGGLEILDVIPAPNVAKADDEFHIDPAFHLKTQRELREKGKAILGVYHSHPKGDSQPSPADHEGAAQPGFYWLITAFQQNQGIFSSLFREIPSETPALRRCFQKVPLQILKVPA